MKLPILDNHIHLQPGGRNVQAVMEFQRMGGTHLILSHLPYSEVTISEGRDFERSYEITVNLAERCRRETGVVIYVVVGPYPVLLLDLVQRFGLERAKEIMMEGIDIAARFVEEGRAVGLGEIGRPHFPVPTEIWEASNDILIYGMSVAREKDCAVVLHAEHSTPENMKEFAEMADSVGLRRERVVKHYSSPLVLPEENHGIFPSILASRSAIREALRKGNRFLMETDFLDDPERPGAVMSPVTVPKRTMAFLRTGLLGEEDVWKIHSENPGRVYGVEFTVD